MRLFWLLGITVVLAMVRDINAVNEALLQQAYDNYLANHNKLQSQNSGAAAAPKSFQDFVSSVKDDGQHDCRQVTIQSWNNQDQAQQQMADCPKIGVVVVKDEQSNNKCEVGTSFHWDGDVVYVSKKCRATFRVCCELPQSSDSDGYMYFREANTYVKFNCDQKQYDKAREVCQDEGGDLIRVDSQMNEFIQENADKSQRYYVGLNDLKDSGNWVWNDEYTPTEFELWADNEPNGNNEHCTLYERRNDDSFRWADVRCNRQECFICQKFPAPQGYTYVPQANTYIKFNCNKKKWNKARDECKNDGGDLLEVNDEINQYVQANVDKSKRFYVGLNDKSEEGVWVWNDENQAAEYTLWASGEPDNSNEDCALWERREDGSYRWADVNCNREECFICQITTDRDEPCREGFKSYGPKCLKIVTGELDYFDASDRCQEFGARLVVVNNPFTALTKLQEVAERQGIHDRSFFIGGSAVFNRDSLNEYLRGVAEHFQITGDKLKALRRFSGVATDDELNYESPVSTKCLALHVGDNPHVAFLECTEKHHFICEQASASVGNDDDATSCLTSWINLNKFEPNDNKEKEELKDILKEYRKGNLEVAGQCKPCENPTAMQCKDVENERRYSKDRTHGLDLKYACENNKIECKKNDQEGDMKCRDFAVRFRCPRTTRNSCKLRSIRKKCRESNKECEDTEDGYKCVQPKKSNKKIDTTTCTFKSLEYFVRECHARGDPHYRTLDGTTFDMQGSCTYVLAKTCNDFRPTQDLPEFTIVTSNHKDSPDDRVSRTKGFEFKLGLKSYRFTRGYFYVDDLKTNFQDYYDEKIKISVITKGSRSHLEIHTDFCLSIKWDNKHTLKVFVPETYMGHICGLCGTFDGDSSNDLFVNANGPNVTPIEFGRYYATAGYDDLET